MCVWACVMIESTASVVIVAPRFVGVWGPGPVVGWVNALIELADLAKELLLGRTDDGVPLAKLPIMPTFLCHSTL